MIQRKILLAVDWTNILFRSLFMSATFGNDSYDNDSELQSFICKFGQDLTYLFKIFAPDKVILMTDNRNAWRKDLLPEGPEGYKANREKNDKWDWDKIFLYADKLKSVMKEKGFDFGSCDRCEADDLLCMTKELIFEKHNDWNIILVSSDADIRQLVDFNKETKQYCAVYNPIPLKGGIKRVFITKSFFEWYCSEDSGNDIFFSNIDNNKIRIKNIITGSGAKIKFEMIDPNNVVLTKIFCGDNGDNVPSFYNWYSNSGKLSRITELKYNKIKDSIGFSTVDDLEIKLPFLKETIETVIKKPLNDIDINERFKRQKLLVELKCNNFPKYIQAYKADLEMYINEDIKIIPNRYNLHTLFKDTEFETFLRRKDNAEQAVFKELDKYVTANSLTELW